MRSEEQRASAALRWQRAVLAVRKEHQGAARLLAGMVAIAPLSPRPGLLERPLEGVAFPLLTAFLRHIDEIRPRDPEGGAADSANGPGTVNPRDQPVPGHNCR